MLLNLHRMLSARSGFTLVELLAVVMILGVLVLIAIPNFSSSIEQSSDAAATANIRSGLSDLVSYSILHDGAEPPSGTYGKSVWDSANKLLSSTAGNRTCTADLVSNGQIFDINNVVCQAAP